MKYQEPNEERLQEKPKPGTGQQRDTERVTGDSRSGSDREADKRSQTDDERVDEASIESFPASDPPQQP